MEFCTYNVTVKFCLAVKYLVNLISSWRQLFKMTGRYLFAGWIFHVSIIFYENRVSPTTASIWWSIEYFIFYGGINYCRWFMCRQFLPFIMRQLPFSWNLFHYLILFILLNLIYIGGKNQCQQMPLEIWMRIIF